MKKLILLIVMLVFMGYSAKPEIEFLKLEDELRENVRNEGVVIENDLSDYEKMDSLIAETFSPHKKLLEKYVDKMLNDLPKDYNRHTQNWEPVFEDQDFSEYLKSKEIAEEVLKMKWVTRLWNPFSISNFLRSFILVRMVGPSEMGKISIGNSIVTPHFYLVKKENESIILTLEDLQYCWTFYMKKKDIFWFPTDIEVMKYKK